MINPTEQDEKEYLELIKEKLQHAIRATDNSVKQYAEELRDNKLQQAGMDEADIVAAGQSMHRMVFTGETAAIRRRKLVKLTRSPYFGRIDFSFKGDTTPVYIGIYTFADDLVRKNLIYDWRAPISSMFYDFELGPAHYQTPSGTIEGSIELKRQYRIRDGQLEFMIENAVSIQDEVLQRELSKSSDDKMKNIVATIQRDQNAVIRNENAPVIIIQGVAGSGKTSIALHRIAFLLYRFRDTLSAKDILIISPNKVFADYISNVLPELGEEHIPEMGMEELAAEVLENKFSFQTFFEQVSAILENKDKQFIERIEFKSSFAFLAKMNQYIIHIENNFFEPKEVRIGKTIIPYPFIEEKFKAYHRIPLLKRFNEVARDMQQFVRNATGRKLSGFEKSQIWETAPQLVSVNNLIDLYKNFFKWLKREDLFVMNGDKLEWSDVFPLIYFKIRLEGVQSYDHVRHLLVDEMQDYTPVQYSVLSRLFKCRKTILGDISQTVNPFSASSSEGINQVFPQAEIVKLTRSYRSTMEILNFALRIYPNPELIPMERHGDEPEVKEFGSNKEEASAIRDLITVFEQSGHKSLGIICKSHDQAITLFEELNSNKIHFLTPESLSFKDGIVITTTHLSKGLEFDEVIVPFASARNYQTEIDKRMLYIACTRAMHKLTLTYSREKTTFV